MDVAKSNFFVIQYKQFSGKEKVKALLPWEAQGVRAEEGRPHF